MMRAEVGSARYFRGFPQIAPQRRHILTFAGFLLFCLLPLSLWLYLFLPAAAVAKMPWREAIVFGVPLGLIALLRAEISKVMLAVVSGATLIFLLVLLQSLLTRDLPVIVTVIGAVPYFATGVLLLSFFSIRKRDLRYMERLLPWAMVIGGGGLVLDFASGFAISLRLEEAGISRVSHQASLVPRALFLYSGTAHAASVLSLAMATVLFSRNLLPHSRASSPSQRIWLLVSFGVAILGILVTFSRVGLLAIALLFAFWLACRRDWRSVLVAVVAVGAVGFASVSLLDEIGRQMLVARMESLVDRNSTEELDLGRTHLWRTAVLELDRNWAVGTGIGTGNPRTQGHGVNIRHYESFPLWVLNEAGLFAAMIMFLPYVIPLFYIFAAGLPAIEKLLALYLLAVIWLIVFVNPGGANLETIAVTSFLCALFRCLPGRRNHFARPSKCST